MHLDCELFFDPSWRMERSDSNRKICLILLSLFILFTFSTFMDLMNESQNNRKNTYCTWSKDFKICPYKKYYYVLACKFFSLTNVLDLIAIRTYVVQ